MMTALSRKKHRESAFPCRHKKGEGIITFLHQISSGTYHPLIECSLRYR